MEFDYRKLKGRIVEKVGTLGTMAELLGVSRASMSNKLHGRSEFSHTDIIKCVEVLGINPDDIGEFFFSECYKNET